ncbi:MAG: pesticidal protein Cry15Aa [Acidobacteriota bacterium]|nr:pesticidal protein Cry15Aa [Acidobacteriota bacterium]
MRGVLLALGLIACTATLPAQQSWQLGPFTRPTDAPVITPDPASIFTDPVLHKPVHWEALHTFNPAAIVRDNRIYVLYRAEDDSGTMQIGMHTSRLGLASSTDGIHFTRLPQPVFYPAADSQQAREWPGGVEDPRIVESPDHTYVLTYTQWNRKTYSIGIATSRDLLHWQKHGPAFLHDRNGKYDHLQYKSGGIVTQLVQGRLLAARIHDRYWMYWGEGAIHLAKSEDLIHWSPVEDSTNAPLEVLHRREGHFDSGFPEVGPPPLLTESGVVMLYNGKNDAEHGDPALGANAYAAGQVLFSKELAVIADRDSDPTLRPEQPFEKTGQYAAGTTFAEGLVYFHNRWFLYYGCADSAVGVAVSAEQPR